MTFWDVWYTHLRDVLVKVAQGLQTSTDGMRVYKLSLIWNAGPVDNQLLHCDCVSPTITWVARGWGGSAMQEEGEVLEDDSDSEAGLSTPIAQLGRGCEGKSP